MGIEPQEELDELLNGEPPEDLNNILEETPEVEEKPAENAPQDEKGEEPELEAKPEGEAEEPEQEEVPPTSEKEADKGVFEAMKAERAKRQLVEMELQQLRAQLAQNQQPQHQENDPQLDPYSDPADFTRSVRGVVANEVSEAIRQDRIERSEAEAIERLGQEKYNQMIEEFKVIALNDPSVMAAGQTAFNPAKFVEQTVEKHRKLAAIGDDPAGYEARIRAEERAKIEAEFASRAAEQTQQTAQKQKIAALPKTIANAGGGAPSANQMPADDLASLLGEV